MFTYSKLFSRYPQLEICRSDLLMALNILFNQLKKSGTLYLCGNGGSSADSEHFAGELLKNFTLPRSLEKNDCQLLDSVDPYLKENLHYGIKAIPLVSFHSTLSAFNNDCNPEYNFAQLIWTLCTPQDVLFAISTSGNSKNIVNALKVAKAKKIPSILLSGRKGGEGKKWADVTIMAPGSEVFEIQEFHLPIYHAFCLELEHEFFSR